MTRQSSHPSRYPQSRKCGRAGGVLASLLLVGATGLVGCLSPRGASPSATVTAVAHNAEAQAVIDSVVGAAASRLGISASAIAIERIESREWSDSSLGCPQPGMMYAQVITPGYFIVVSGGGKRLEYHADTRGRAVMCREL